MTIQPDECYVADTVRVLRESKGMVTPPVWEVQEDVPEEVVSRVTPEGWHSGTAEKSSMC